MQLFCDHNKYLTQQNSRLLPLPRRLFRLGRSRAISLAPSRRSNLTSCRPWSGEASARPPRPRWSAATAPQPTCGAPSPRRHTLPPPPTAGRLPRSRWTTGSSPTARCSAPCPLMRRPWLLRSTSRTPSRCGCSLLTFAVLFFFFSSSSIDVSRLCFCDLFIWFSI